MILKNILDAIGKTPIVKLNRIGIELDCDLYGKCEFINAGGSVKDRAALALIKDAEEEERIFLKLRESKPDNLINVESASKKIGELLTSRVKNELNQLHNDAKESNNLEPIRKLGDVHNAQNAMQNDGYNIFSPEADFLIEWLRERLEK